MLSAVERMESRDRQLRCVADVVEIRRRHENVGVLRCQPDRQLSRRLGHCLRMSPPAPQRTQQVAGVILGPLLSSMAHTVRHLRPKRGASCENFLYRIKEAGLRAALAGRPRPVCPLVRTATDDLTSIGS